MTEPATQPAPGSRSLLSSAAWNILALLTLGVVGFVTVPIVVREIGESDYGLFLLVGMIGGFAALLDLGLGEATLKFVAQYHARRDLVGVNRVLGATLTIYLIAGVAGGAVIVACASWIARLFKLEPQQLESAARLVALSGLAFVLSLVATAMRTIPEAVQRFDVSSKLRIVMAVVQGVAMIAAVKLGYGVTGLVVWMVAYTVLNLLVAFVVAVKLIPGVHPWPAPSRAGIREVFGYGMFSFSNQMIATVSTYVDRLILAAYFGPADVTVLSVPQNLLARGAGVYSAGGAALFPRFSSMKEGPAMRGLFVNSTWSLLCFSLVLFVPTTIVMPEFLRLWMGEAFARQSAAVAQIIAASMAVQGAFVPYFSLLKGTGRVHWLTVIYLLTTGLGVVAAVALVPMFGVMGAGYRLWVMVWAGFAVILIVCRKVFPEASLRSVVTTYLTIPLLAGLGCGVGFWWVWTALGLKGWVWIIAAWVVMASTLSLLLWASNRVLSGPQGAAAQFLASMRTYLGRGDRPVSDAPQEG